MICSIILIPIQVIVFNFKSQGHIASILHYLGNILERLKYRQNKTKAKQTKQEIVTGFKKS